MFFFQSRNDQMTLYGGSTSRLSQELQEIQAVLLDCARWREGKTGGERKKREDERDRRGGGKKEEKRWEKEKEQNEQKVRGGK